MADKLTATEMAELAGPQARMATQYTLTVGGTDYTDRLLKVGRVKWKLANAHPARKAKLTVPVLVVTVDNRDGLFAVGNPAGPFTDDTARRDTAVRVVVKILSGQRTVLDFTGAARRPTQKDTGEMDLQLEHAACLLERRTFQQDTDMSYAQTTVTLNRDATP
jgi:hypothetical protein